MATCTRFLLAALSLFLSIPAVAMTWQQPSPEELSMTAEPAAPGASAIYLFREEIADDKLHYHSMYVRMKILTEEGKKYADVELPTYIHGEFNLSDIQARTIHSDGTVIPFTGKPFEKLVSKTKTESYQTKVFTMPDVQVGSILEYRYQLNYGDYVVLSPRWYIQQELFVRSAHYRFLPTIREIEGNANARLSYTRVLPQGVDVKYAPMQNTYEVSVQNIPAIAAEEYMPPIHSVTYRVLFYYTTISNVDEFWKDKGKNWSKETDRFAAPSKLSGAVQTIVQPGDKESEKVSKIYTAVMKLENTSFTREHTAAENKEQGVKIKTAADIWEQKRGSADELALLFIGLARAAGLKAYAMYVTNRDNEVFIREYLGMDQLDDEIAIVEVDGKEQYYDPGQRYCLIGQLHWKHGSSMGLRQTEHGTALAETPGAGYKDSLTNRIANLKLDPDGSLHGSITLSFKGVEALYWRQAALKADQEEVKKQMADRVEATLPPGVHVKTHHFLGMDDPASFLIVRMDVTGNMGTATGKRVLLPSTFFEVQSKPLFTAVKREAAVDLHYCITTQDEVTLELPKNFEVESLPKSAAIPLPKNALYSSSYQMKDNVYIQKRVMILANVFFLPSEYGSLKDFYQKVGSQDQEQAILELASAGTGQ